MMIDCALVKYQAITLWPLSNKMMRNTRKTLLDTASKKVTNRSHSLMYRDVEDIFKQVLNHSAADNALSSRRDRFTKSLDFPQNIVSCVIKKLIFTASIIKLDETHAKITFLSGA